MKNRPDGTYDEIVMNIARLMADKIEQPLDEMSEVTRACRISDSMAIVDLFDFLDMQPEEFVAAWRAAEPAQ